MNSPQPTPEQDNGIASAPPCCKNCGAVVLDRFCGTCSQAANVHVPTLLGWRMVISTVFAVRRIFARS